MRNILVAAGVLSLLALAGCGNTGVGGADIVVLVLIAAVLRVGA